MTRYRKPAKPRYLKLVCTSCQQQVRSGPRGNKFCRCTIVKGRQRKLPKNWEREDRL